MKRLAVGVRVRFVGQPHPFENPLCLIVVGRTGVIRSRSEFSWMDWFVEMDIGNIDIDVLSAGLVPIDDDEADTDTQAAQEIEAA